MTNENIPENTGKKWAKFFTKEYWKEKKRIPRFLFPRWGKMKLPNIWLIICLSILFGSVVLAFFSKKSNGVKDVYYFAISNIPVTICFIVITISSYIWIRNRKVYTEKSLLDAKVAMILAVMSAYFALFYREKAVFTVLEKEKIRAEYKQKLDSTEKVLKKEYLAKEKESGSFKELYDSVMDAIVIYKGRIASLEATASTKDKSIPVQQTTEKPIIVKVSEPKALEENVKPSTLRLKKTNVKRSKVIPRYSPPKYMPVIEKPCS